MSTRRVTARPKHVSRLKSQPYKTAQVALGGTSITFCVFYHEDPENWAATYLGNPDNYPTEPTSSRSIHSTHAESAWHSLTQLLSTYRERFVQEDSHGQQ